MYERELPGTVDNHRLRPDFSFIDDAGDIIIWEHLGMLDRPDYAGGWDWKRAWYARNGYEVGKNLFTTSEIGGLDMRGVEATQSRSGRAGMTEHENSPHMPDAEQLTIGSIVSLRANPSRTGPVIAELPAVGGRRPFRVYHSAALIRMLRGSASAAADEPGAESAQHFP